MKEWPNVITQTNNERFKSENGMTPTKNEKVPCECPCCLGATSKHSQFLTWVKIL